MNTKAMVLGVLALAVFAFGAWADSVETWDGLLLEGTIIAGVPDVLKMDDNGVAVSIRKTAILDILFDEEGQEQARVTTTTGRTFQDRVLTLVGTVTIRTASGETEVPNTQIREIRFPYTQTESPTYKATAYLNDGRYYEGNPSTAFPSTISIESSGITSNVKVDSIISMSLGGIDRIETPERTYQGTIVSNLPSTIYLTTKYGELAIQRADIDRISFSQEVSSGTLRERSPMGFGVGAKMLGQIPLVLLQLRFGSVQAEAGLGMSAGSLVFDAIGKYRLTIISGTLYIYGGGGAFGVPGAAVGFEVLGGAEFSFDGLVNFPLSLFGGADVISVGGFTASGWHFGLRWDF